MNDFNSIFPILFVIILKILENTLIALSSNFSGFFWSIRLYFLILLKVSLNLILIVKSLFNSLYNCSLSRLSKCFSNLNKEYKVSLFFIGEEKYESELRTVI